MTTAREENISFGIKSLTLYDYDTGKPYCVKQFSGGNATLNVAVNLAMLEGANTFGPIAVEAYGGAISFDATFKELPAEIIQIANQASLSSITAASATVTVTDQSGSTIGAQLVSTFVSAGQGSSIVNDTIYMEALTSSTVKIISFYSGKDSGSKSAASTASIMDANVAPAVVFQFSSAVSLNVGDTALIETVKTHDGYKEIEYGKERPTSLTYVGVKGVAVNASDGNEYEFELYKTLIGGLGSLALNYGDFNGLTLHGDAQVDTSRATPAAGNLRLMQGT